MTLLPDDPKRQKKKPKDKTAVERQRHSRKMREAGYVYFRGWLPPKAVSIIPEWDQDDADKAGEAAANILLKFVTRDTDNF